MTISASSGPLVVFGSDSNYTAETNPEQATSLFYAGVGVLDPRPYYGYHPGQDFGAITAGWGASTGIVSLAGIPKNATSNLIAAVQHTVSGTAMTLASATAEGVSVGNTIYRADTGAAVTGLLQLDPAVAAATVNLTAGSNVLNATALTAPGTHCYNRLNIGMTLTDATTAGNLTTGTTIIGYGTGGGDGGTYYMSAPAVATATGDSVTAIQTAFPLAVPVGQTFGGQAGTIRLFNPAALISRCIIITASSASAATTTFAVRGFDVYGYPMTENILVTPASALTTTGKKAFKYILSVTPNATDATYNFSVGTVDTIGFPIRTDQFSGGYGPDVVITANTAIITSATGYTAAVLTTPTATTGDVRGTYALQTASDGTKIYVFTHSPSIANLGNGAVGLYGQTQYADF